MGLGILNDTKLQHVPGTATVFDDESRLREENAVHDPNLKYDSTGTIILIPQPSNDPNDPLNWPLWRRDLILLTLSLLSVIASTLSPLLAADTLSLSLYFGRTFTDVALLTGYHLLGVGVAGFLFVPSARIWGKRHLYLLGTVVLVFSSAWGGASNKNYKSLLWARIFQGIGLAPFEALVNASVGDLYHVHQRGKRMALSNLALFGGAFFTPVLVGKIADTMSWQWTFYFVAIFSGALLPVVVFFVPETAFRRDAVFNTDTATTNTPSPRLAPENRIELETSPNSAVESTRDSQQDMTRAMQKEMSVEHADDTAPPPEKASWAKSLLPFNGRKSDDRYLNLLLRPFTLFFHPGIFWACLIQGTLIGWTVMIGIVLAAIMLGPPLFFGEVETGYMYTGAFVGALLGFVLAGLISDWSASYLTRLNRGIYEPEFRLILVIPQLIFGCAGLYGFGIVSNNIGKYKWFWPDFFFALEVMGMVLGAVASALYIVDAHREISVEAFTCLLVFKNIFSFGLTWSSYDWLVQTGVKPVFMAVASVQVVVCLLSVPMYIFGKKNRSFVARHNVFFKISDKVADWLTFW
ncbi:MFS general substrate transporter [Mytilinidion resinicola]|uniref:MFS general substrate transporter n=1 Tax=Mytilinidion resinicola TaxID=574789 RepID=A0A6A6YPN7_9PEZI|nr:MFS general substrate transporter [Mytilinidion resinicola]KAF2810513.1 MFS general substrate transporter [Mytilinidion resinicola]